MSGKLDQSLDEILSSRRKTNRRAVGRAVKKGKVGTAAAAPVGGVKKSTKQAKPAAKTASVASGPAPKDSKIVVSGLPTDVNESQIKEYFQKSVGSVKRVVITYNQQGVSRGVAQVFFVRAESAAKAAKDLNGMLVDKRPMKIELVLDASAAPAPAPVKTLGERVAANPKAQPKSATVKKAETTGTRGGKAGRGRGRARRTPGRPKKTAEELDAEMTDYMSGGVNTADANGTSGTAAAPAATNGEDLGMDEIS